MGENLKQSLKQYLKNNTLLTDGAMGTFFATLKPEADYIAELGNIYDEELIFDIHKKYINAGAKLIRTNTFAANITNLKDSHLVEKVIRKGCEIAKKACDGEDVFLGASIGPIADISGIKPYTDIIDIFLDMGIDIFVFETFNNYKCLELTSKYLRQKNPNAFIITQFALTDIGITKKSVSAENIINAMNNAGTVDAIGFNCGVGPTHMFNVIKRLSVKPEFMSALPNAGYPEIIDGKVEYVMNPKYFAKMVNDISKLGVKIVGGCCGTTPEHIKLLSQFLSGNKDNQIDIKDNAITNVLKVSKPKKIQENKFESKFENKFHKSLESGKFIVAVELDPPFKTDASKLISGAKYLKEKGVDLITIADSPMGKARADSVVMSAKILREAGIDTLPHICCRDKNSIALRAVTLAAYIEGIRNFLVVTGDPVQVEYRAQTKSVFNLNSYSLMSMINEMNTSVFEEGNVKIGGAINFNVKNKESEYKRLLKKCENGAEFFLTQPIFTQEAIDFIKNINKDRKFKIFGGIMPLVSYKNAQFINNELPGITIPDEYISRFNPDMQREEAQQVGIEIAIDIAQKIKPYVDGFYITAPFNRYEMVGEILDKIL